MNTKQSLAALGYSDVSPLPPADNSAFSINIYVPEEDTVDHYTLYAAGEP